MHNHLFFISGLQFHVRSFEKAASANNLGRQVMQTFVTGGLVIYMWILLTRVWLFLYSTLVFFCLLFWFCLSPLPGFLYSSLTLAWPIMFADWILTLASLTTLIPAQPFLICSSQCLTQPCSPSLTVTSLCSLYSDSGEDRVSPAGLHPSNGTLFFILFNLLFLIFVRRSWKETWSPLRVGYSLLRAR